MSLISVKNLSVSFGAVQALTNITFEVQAGEFVGLIGPNGAGKTTLLRVLLGLQQPSSGKLKVPPLADIAYVSQKNFLEGANFAISVAEVLAMGARKMSFLASFTQQKKMREKLELVGLDSSFLKKRFADLSGGQKQRVIIARALMKNPKLLLFDEPTSGVDHPAKIRLYATLAELNQKYKTGIIFVSHELEHVIQHCNRVLCLNKTLHEGCHPMDVFKEAATQARLAPDDILLPIHHHHTSQQ